MWVHWRKPAPNALKPVTVSQFLPKAAAAILALPGVESLEREGADWVCHLRFGWTTKALGGGGTIIDSNLKTIRAHVTGAYELPPVAAPARAAGPLLPGELAAPAALAPAAPAPELPELPSRFASGGFAGLQPWGNMPGYVVQGQQQQQPQQQPQQPQQTPAAALAPRAARAAWRAASETVRSGEASPALLEKVAAEITGRPPVAPAPVVAPGPRARDTAPLGLPPDAAALLQRFNLSLDGLLTAGASSPKLSKGDKVAASVILHHLPARSLSSAVYGSEDAATAPRSRLAGLELLAARNGMSALVAGHNGCPWASKGCSAGCLAWAGHGGISTTVAAARARRTMAFVWGHGPYALAVLWAIGRAYAAAQRKGQPLAYRLRGTDDLPWHALRFNLSPAEAATFARRFGLPVVPGIGTTIPEALQLAAPGTLQPYEYSAAPLRGPLGLLAQRSAGIDTTCSLKADRPGGCGDAAEAVAAGFRVAVPVAIRKGQPLPPVLMLRPSTDGPILRLLTVDGDLTDHRWLDPQGPQPGGFDGVAVMLRTKVSRGRGPAAAAFSLAPTAERWQPLAGGGHAALSQTTWVD